MDNFPHAPERLPIMPEPDSIPPLTTFDCGMSVISGRISMFRRITGNCYLSPNAVIDGRAIGSSEAGGVVLEDDPTGCKVVGNPARPFVLTKRPSDDGEGA
jgi:hypothetical protein